MMLKVYDVRIKKADMQAIGAQVIEWNGGAFSEYYLPLTGNGRGFSDSRLGVRFGEHSYYPVLAWLELSVSMLPLPYVKTIEQFKTMYGLLTGKELRC